MLTFREFLVEAESIKAEHNKALATGGELHTLGHVNEHIAAAHAAAGNHKEAERFSSEAKKHHTAAEKELSKVPESAAEDTRARSKVVAKGVIDMHKKQYDAEHPKAKEHEALANINATHHTPTGISKITGKTSHQRDDTADIVLSTKKSVNGSHHHGVSYKNNKSTTKSSNGLPDTDASLGTSHVADLAKFREHMSKKYPKQLGTGASEAVRKSATESHPEIKADTRKFQEHSAQSTHQAFSNLKNEAARKAHIKNAFRLNTTIPTMLAQGSGTAASAKAHVTDDDAKKRDIIDKASKITSRREGTVVKYTAHLADGSKHELGAQDHRFTHSGHNSYSLTGKA